MSKRKAKLQSPRATKSVERPAGRFSGRGVALTCAGLFLLVFLVFLPAASNDFVNYDDQDYVTENPHVKAGLTAAGVAWAFTTGHASNWHPLTWISHMIDCQLYGLKPWGHHLTSVLFHAVNAMLLFVVLQRMTGAMWKSLLVALLFGLHPLRVESVAWVAERKDVLSTFFWMLTLWAYVLYAEKSKSRSSRSKVYYGLALFFFVCGLMSKPMLVTLPFVLLLLDWWPLGRISNGVKGETARMGCVSLKRAVVEKVPFVAVAAASAVATFMAQRQGGSVVDIASLPVLARWENALVAYVRYVGKLFWPMDLAVFYPSPNHWPVVLLICSGVFLLVISGWVYWRRREQPYLALGWFWLLGTLVPVIGLVQVGSQSLADRYTYVPGIGIFIMLVWGLAALGKRIPASALAPLAAAAILACMFMTEQQITYWKDGETLFGRAVAVTSGNSLAHNSLGFMLSERGKYDAAIEQFQAALRIRPDYAKAQYNWGLALAGKRQVDEAIVHFQAALLLDPFYFEARNNLGVAYYAKGQYDEAAREFEAALQLRPGDPAILQNLQTVREDKAATRAKPPGEKENKQP